MINWGWGVVGGWIVFGHVGGEVRGGGGVYDVLNRMWIVGWLLMYKWLDRGSGERSEGGVFVS